MQISDSEYVALTEAAARALQTSRDALNAAKEVEGLVAALGVPFLGQLEPPATQPEPSLKLDRASFQPSHELILRHAPP